MCLLSLTTLLLDTFNMPNNEIFNNNIKTTLLQIFIENSTFLPIDYKQFIRLQLSINPTN